MLDQGFRTHTPIIGNPKQIAIGNPYRLSAKVEGMPTTTVAERIVAAREALDLTQAAFARKLGIKQPSLSNLEDGKTKRPAASTLLAMRDAGINPDYIMKSKGPILLAEAERSMREQALVAMFRAMEPEAQDQYEALGKILRRGNQRPGLDDPFLSDAPKPK